MKPTPSSHPLAAACAPTWQAANGQPIACTEKIKVLNQNLEELQQMAQDALEDGILMGCSEAQIKEAFVAAILALHNPYPELK